MKIRQGFVSNSSSSSFIVYVNDTNTDSVDFSKYRKFFKRTESFHFEDTITKCYKLVLPIGKPKDFESFGWEFVRRSTFEDKVNFLFLQIRELSKFCEYPSEYYESKYKELSNYCYRVRNEFELALKTILRKSKKIKGNVLLHIHIDYNAIEWNSIYDDSIGIDHQSLWTEEFWGSIIKDNPEELFKVYYPWLLDSEKIIQFLVGGSYIQCGNDNTGEEGEGYKEWKESKDIEMESIKDRLPKEEKEKE